MILNCMLGTGYGGLEKLFLDEIEMLPMAGLAARGLVRRESPLARYARDRGLAFDEMIALSDWDPLSIAGARRIVRRQAPQLIMCVGRKAHRLLGRAIGTRIPIVPMVQKRRFDRDFPYAGVLVAAEHRRRTLIEDGVPAQDIIVIPNAVRLPERPKWNYRTGDTTKIVTLGRLHEKKGFGVLIEAIGILASRSVDCTCAIAGDGPERSNLQSQIDRGTLASRISLSGWTDNVADFLTSGDIFVLPSFQEDLPLAVLDAMASGMPIVASDIDGPNELLVDGETALLVPSHDPEAVASALTRLAQDEILRERLGRGARAAAKRSYSFGAVGRSLALALHNVLEGRPISSGT
ncbi:MAG TPA: glycosyltransferase [Rhizomicrobium sp.]|jgi:glycosyltransferase involved in cell wall biosynthesis|nr:glycosyltransferase [Rhizomicrobium sp.]